MLIYEITNFSVSQLSHTTMSFTFNFGGNNDSEKSSELSDEIEWLTSEELTISNKQINELDDKIPFAKMFTCGELEIGHIVVKDAISNMNVETKMNATKLAKDENSDLITGKYEGGLKIWECTNDLIEYLLGNEADIKMQDIKVLDLGCGAGILGIYAFLKGSCVTFQDYNKEVLEYVTIPNMLLNIDDDDNKVESIKRCKFFSGDWASFNENLAEDIIYDLILTSETIYNEKNYNKLIKLFQRRLSDKGTIYVAAKTCYFGVGGGIRQFEAALNKTELFKHEVCWKNTVGIQREILRIMKKS